MKPEPGRSLLDPGFLRQLEVLGRRLNARARSRGPGGSVARRRGSSAEFEDHRSYAPGDDPRRIDWAAYARLGEPLIKQFRSEEDYILRVVLDASASVALAPVPVDDRQQGVEPNPAWSLALRFTAAISYLALASEKRLQLLVAGGRGSTGSLRTLFEPLRGRAQLGRVLHELERIQPGGSVDLARAIDLTLHTARRSEWVVWVSDFLSPTPLTPPLARLRAKGHDLSLVHLVDPGAALHEDGDLCLVDVETGETVDVTLDDAALSAFTREREAWARRLQRWARETGSGYVSLSPVTPLEHLVRQFVDRVAPRTVDSLSTR